MMFSHRHCPVSATASAIIRHNCFYGPLIVATPITDTLSKTKGPKHCKQLHHNELVLGSLYRFLWNIVDIIQLEFIQLLQVSPLFSGPIAATIIV